MLEQAKELAGNHKDFSDFSWFDEPKDSENWMIIPIETRDGDLLEQSNAAFITKTLKPFDVEIQRFNHWACGWMDHIIIQVFDGEQKEENITDIFKKFLELKKRIENYPVLDEKDYCEREHKDTLKSIKMRMPNCDCDPEKIFDWLWDYNPDSLESVDGFGGYPSEKDICKALDAMEIKYEEI